MVVRRTVLTYKCGPHLKILRNAGLKDLMDSWTLFLAYKTMGTTWILIYIHITSIFFTTSRFTSSSVARISIIFFWKRHTFASFLFCGTHRRERTAGLRTVWHLRIHKVYLPHCIRRIFWILNSPFYKSFPKFTHVCHWLHLM
jgi:hypothetical protein